jgi:hypothetical protein
LNTHEKLPGARTTVLKTRTTFVDSCFKRGE